MDADFDKQPVVIALGGNAIIGEGEEGNLEQQWSHTRETMDEVAAFIEGNRDLPVVLTHGNGPQVGNIILRAEIAAPTIFSIPLDVAVADTEGAMGYMIQVALNNALASRGLRRSIVTLVTQSVVDPADVAFQSPTKFIGRWYSADEAKERMSRGGWAMKEVAGKGWRRVVASPRPLRIIESDVVGALTRTGTVVIAAGGGGIPVTIDSSGEIRGIEAVVDKDLASALLASELGARRLVILTGSDGVWLDWGRPGARRIPTLTVEEARRHLADGQFPAGSMGPKIEAAMDFLARGGSEVVIGRHDLLVSSLEGRSGTRIIM